jgi:outer membrane protein TolC
LEVLLARYPGGDSLPGGAPLPASLTPVATGHPAELVTRRPDLIAAELRLTATGLDVRAARAALYPRLRLTASVGRSSIEAKDLLDEDFSIWSLAMGLVQPLFQGGRLRASLSAAEALQRQAAEAYLTAALAAFSEVEAALAAERFLHESLEALAVAADQSLAARDLAERRYRSGLEEYLTVLESQRQATVSQSLLLLARRRQVEARIDLHLALGGDYNQGSASSADAIRESS